MDDLYTVGRQLLIRMPGDVLIVAIVEEEENDAIFVKYIQRYKEKIPSNEWISKDSHRIRSILDVLETPEENLPDLKLKKPNKNTSDIKSVTTVTPISTKKTLPTSAKEFKKPVTSIRSSSVFKVRFKKDDFLTKKAQGNKNKEQKIMKDNKKLSDRDAKKCQLINASNNEKPSTIELKEPNDVEKLELESGTSIENLNSSKNQDETILLKSENFEELLEDIEAEAEICSPTKFVPSDNKKQKKKRKRFFLGVRRRSDKKRLYKRKKDDKINKLVINLKSSKVNKQENTLLEKLSNTEKAAESTSKRIKLSLPDNNIVENSAQLINNSLLQKIRMDATDEQGFRCPKQTCRKLFRRENLLMMHIKHYHSEYTDLLVSTPNVTDLATARIEGENVDELSPYYLNKISQIEAKKNWSNTSYNSPTSSAVSTIPFTKPDSDSNSSIQSENYNTTFTSVDKTNNISQAYDSKDSGFCGYIQSTIPISETSVNENSETKEPINKITLVGDTKNDITDTSNPLNRHFKIKKKNDVKILPKEEVINCSCYSNEEEGFMIQCDVCLCWQHGYCNNINSEDQVPDNYICTSCLNPSKKRQSKQYDYLQDWIKEGTVPSVLQHKDERRRKDENILKQSHQLTAEVIEHANFLQSLLVKTEIYGKTPDHPKLYLWSENGSKRNEEPPTDKLEELLSGPVPEKPINTTECRKNLLSEIEDGFNNLEARINLFEAKTNGLEDQVNGCVDNEAALSTVTMLLQDMKSIRHHLSFENKHKKSEEI